MFCLPSDGVSAHLFSVDLSTSWMSQDGSERSSTSIFCHFDHAVEGHVGLPVRPVASRRASNVLPVSRNFKF